MNIINTSANDNSNLDVQNSEFRLARVAANELPFDETDFIGCNRPSSCWDCGDICGDYPEDV
jgi:hypothetical protein